MPWTMDAPERSSLRTCCRLIDMIDTQDLTKKDTPLKERRRLGVGDIWQNAATCGRCKDHIRSKNRHDYVVCKCEALSVDGGSWYAKRGMSFGATYVDDVIPYDEI